MAVPSAFSNPNILPCEIIPCGPVVRGLVGGVRSAHDGPSG